MKSLKLDDEELHRRFKTCCAESQITMLDAVHQMVKSWCEAVEKRKPGLQSNEPTRATPATRPKPGKPSRRQELDANGQQGIPISERPREDSTKLELDDLERIARRHRTA